VGWFSLYTIPFKNAARNADIASNAVRAGKSKLWQNVVNSLYRLLCVDRSFYVKAAVQVFPRSSRRNSIYYGLLPIAPFHDLLENFTRMWREKGPRELGRRLKRVCGFARTSFWLLRDESRHFLACKNSIPRWIVINFAHFASAHQFANSRTRRCFYSPSLPLLLNFIYLSIYFCIFLFVNWTYLIGCSNCESNIIQFTRLIVKIWFALHHYRWSECMRMYAYILPVMKKLCSLCKLRYKWRNYDPRDLWQVVLINGFYIPVFSRDQEIVRYIDGSFRRTLSKSYSECVVLNFFSRCLTTFTEDIFLKEILKHLSLVSFPIYRQFFCHIERKMWIYVYTVSAKSIRTHRENIF